MITLIAGVIGKVGTLLICLLVAAGIYAIAVVRGFGKGDRIDEKGKGGKGGTDGE